MSHAVFTFLGGIGLFLFGMENMTSALRELAGGGMRRWLARFTTTPLRGLLTGIGATALIQSSTAVTLMTIGFVGAGIIQFTQALGVLFGASVGTTVTGWIVVLLGFKLKLGTIALPVMLVAALMGLLGQGYVARTGRMLAGLALMFIGLDMMQTAMAGLEGVITPDRLPGESFAGQMGLAVLGMVLVMLIQSSSAGVALVLVMLGTGAISLVQSAALVIGMSVGTTFTALLASIGGSRAVRMTAVANLLYHFGTALLAFPLMWLVLGHLKTLAGGDQPTALVLFHSLVHLSGAVVFLPFTTQFGALIGRLVPERHVPLAAALDRRLLRDEFAAMDAAQVVCDAIRVQQAEALAAAMQSPPDLRRLAALPPQTGAALEALEAWMAQIRVTPERKLLLARYGAMVYQIDHLHRLQERLSDNAAAAAAQLMPALARPARVLALRIAEDSPDADKAHWLEGVIRSRAKQTRRAALSTPMPAPSEAYRPGLFAQSDAARWLARVADHLASIARHREEATLEAHPHSATA